MIDFKWLRQREREILLRNTFWSQKISLDINPPIGGHNQIKFKKEKNNLFISSNEHCEDIWIGLSVLMWFCQLRTLHENLWKNKIVFTPIICLVNPVRIHAGLAQYHITQIKCINVNNQRFRGKKDVPDSLIILLSTTKQIINQP